MALISRLPLYHTIRDFRAAAGHRYQEGRRLALAGDRLAAIYLWGYAAEMLLKAAYFRLAGWAPVQPITVQDLHQAKSYAVQQIGLEWPSNLHDLGRWKDLLVEERIVRQVPYGATFARSLNARVNQIYVNWREYLRYHRNRPFQGEVSRVFQAAHWLLGQYPYL